MAWSDNHGDEVAFNFRVSQSGGGSNLGHFAFCDPANLVCVTDSKVRNLFINGNAAELAGHGHLEDGSEVSFRVSVTDSGESGTLDTIAIQLNTGYSVSGTLIRGDIRIF